jgi:hypothetical protein
MGTKERKGQGLEKGKKNGSYSQVGSFSIYCSTLFNIAPSIDPQIPLCTDGCWGGIEPWAVSKVAFAVGDA